MEKSLNFNNKKPSKPSKTYSYPHLHKLSQNSSFKSNHCSPRVRTNTLPNIVYNTTTATPSPPPGFDSSNENVNSSPITSYQFSATIEPPSNHRQNQQILYPSYQLFDNSNNQLLFQPKINENGEEEEEENIPSREELFQMWNNFEISNN